MKAIHYLATILLFAAGMIHVYMFGRDPESSNSAIVLIFGIIYLIVGILLYVKMKYSPVLGIIFPLGGIIAGLLVFDPAARTPLLGILGIMDALVVILCLILAWDGRNRGHNQ